MKKIAIVLVSFLLVLTACGGQEDHADKQTKPVDAAAIAVSIAAPQYIIDDTSYAEPSWVEDDLIRIGHTVYYICRDEDRAILCSLDCVSLQRTELYSSVSDRFLGISASQEHLYVLALDEESEHYKMIELSINGGETRKFSLDAGIFAEKAIRDFAYADDLLFVLCDDRLVAYSISDSLKEVYSRDILSTQAVLTKTTEDKLILGLDENGSFSLLKYNAKKRDWDKLAAFNMTFNRISCGGVWEYYLSDSRALFGYSTATGTLEKLFSWSALGINSGQVAELEDGRLVSSARINPEEKGPLLFLKKREDSSREISAIKLATTSEYLDYRIQEAIAAWNVQNLNHPIEVINYSVFYDGSDPRAAQMRLATDIASGNAPDIYDFSMISIDTIPSSGQFARRGMLEDLYPYIDADPELSREDFFAGYLRSLEISGGLYELVPEISITTTFANAKAVGDPSSWTYAQLNEALSQSDHYETLFDNHYSRVFWLGNAIASSGDKLVNWETGKCFFDSDYFKSILETAKTIPEEGLPHEFSTLNKDVQNSTALLYYCNIGDIWMASIAPDAFGENYRFVGFPDVGNVIYPSLCFGISSISQNKQECWEFLRQFMTRKYNASFFMTPRRDGMEAQINNRWAEVVADGNDSSHPYGLKAMEEIISIAEKATIVARHDSQIWQIVWSEAGAYFAGQRSVEETMNLIQSRAQIYMAEQG